LNQPIEQTLTAADGMSLHVTDWPCNNAETARGGVVIMHGLGEHSGRHAHVARFLNDCGWAVRTYDHRGHGRSGGKRGDAPDDETIVRDAKTVVDDFARKLEAPPLLLGHSMGGLFAARFAAAAASPLRGLILSSPALALRLSGTQKLLLKIFSAIAPGIAVSNGVDIHYLSHDPAVGNAYNADPLVHGKITARLLRSMLAAADFVNSRASTLAVPTLLLVACDDRLVDPSGSDAFFARLAPGIGTIHRYHGLYHELFNEKAAQQVFDDLRNWLGRLAVGQNESAA
jgi:alpha-beta hydrolase superfamily lysophospholipase